MLIHINDASKKYVERDILKQVEFTVEDRDKIGIVGINGMGKSTLLKCLAGVEKLDCGERICKNGIRINYLEQDPIFTSGTILEVIKANIKEEQEFEAKSMLTRLGFTDYNQPSSTLSGGGKKRLALAIALLHECDVLMLDEPTNHLDGDMILWLEKYLQKFTKAVVMVTHDRYFLERVASCIVEVDSGNVYTYEANYSLYLEMKEKREEEAYSIYKKRKNILRRELEWIRSGVQARGTKSKERIDRYEKLKSETVYQEKSNLSMDLVSSRLGKKTIELTNVSFEIEGRKLLNEFSYIVDRNGRLGIVGTNGIGKSTLLELIAGNKVPTSGTIEQGETVRIGYFTQHAHHFKENERVIDAITDISDSIETSEGRVSASFMLERFLFPKSMHYQMVSRLSGGEKRRLHLLQVLMEQPNILLLDEPTNDLDITTLSILEDYLEEFPGAVLCVSHDRFFLDKVVDHVLEIRENGESLWYLGGYSEYLENRITIKEKTTKGDTRSVVERFTSKEKQELERLEKRMEEIPVLIAELDSEMNVIEDYVKISELSAKRDSLSAELEECELNWLELSAKKERIEGKK